MTVLRPYIYTTNALAGVRASVAKLVPDQTRQVLGDKAGATAIEYGLITASIAVAIIAVVLLVGEDLAHLFDEIDEEIKNCTKKPEKCIRK